MHDVDPYPLHAIVELLTAAGWSGKSHDGWLFHAHLAAEAGIGTPPVVYDLERRLELSASPELVRAAGWIVRDFERVGVRRRKDIDVAESAIGWMVSGNRRSADLRRLFGL